MNEIQVFKFNDNQVRVIEKNGEPWWVLKDVCEVLELSDTNKVAERLEVDELTRIKFVSGGQTREMYIVSESGLYNVIIRSDKPEAKQFKRWIIHEVLPSIRKHGPYMTPETIEKALFNPDFIIGLAQNLKEERQKNEELASKIERDVPKVLFADSVTASRTDILIGELAKLLKQNGWR